MADSFVQVALDGAGKKIRNLLNTIGANDVYQQVVSFAKSDGTLVDDLSRSSVTQPVSAASLPLPTGAATEAGHLAAIDANTAKIPAQGQAPAATSIPVVLPAAQQTALTPPPAITGFALEGTPLTGQTLEAGGASSSGWLSSIRKAITDRLPAALTASGNLKATLGDAATATTAPISTTAPAGTEAGVYVRVVSQPPGGGGGGPADVATTTAASETDATRQKVTSVIRVLDTTQAASSQLVALKGDSTSGLWANIKNATIAVTGTFWQAIQPVSGTVTANQGTPRAFTATGWPVNPYGMSDTLFASGSVTGAGAGVAIATLAAPPAGTYRVDLLTMVMGDGTTAPLFQNMQLQKGAAVLVAFLDGVGNQAATTPTGNGDALHDLRITVDGATAISINATAAYGATDIAIARIVATRIG